MKKIIFALCLITGCTLPTQYDEYYTVEIVADHPETVRLSPVVWVSVDDDPFYQPVRLFEIVDSTWTYNPGFVFLVRDSIYITFTTNNPVRLFEIVDSTWTYNPGYVFLVRDSIYITFTTNNPVREYHKLKIYPVKNTVVDLTRGLTK